MAQLSNTEIVAQNQELINKCIYYQTRKYGEFKFIEDLTQDLNLILLEYDNERLNMIVDENHLNAFITGILSRQLFSSNSPYYKRYKKFLNLSNEITPYISDIIRSDY